MRGTDKSHAYLAHERLPVQKRASRSRLSVGMASLETILDHLEYVKVSLKEPPNMQATCAQVQLKSETICCRHSPCRSQSCIISQCVFVRLFHLDSSKASPGRSSVDGFVPQGFSFSWRDSSDSSADPGESETKMFLCPGLWQKSHPA